jgi:tagaturonate reductase
MGDEEFSAYVRRLMMLEIAGALDTNIVTYNEACAFANQVTDRFRNPFLDHKWISISMNYTSKMKMRNVPLLVRYFKKNGTVPEEMALGFAAYLYFMKGKPADNGEYQGELNGTMYNIQDESAGYFANKWNDDVDTFVNEVLANEELWGADLTKLKGFAPAVSENLRDLQKEGAQALISARQTKKTMA